MLSRFKQIIIFKMLEIPLLALKLAKQEKPQRSYILLYMYVRYKIIM
jgi:hypothetical protein